MRKSWAVAAMAVLMVSGGAATAQAGDDWDARMAKQCPNMAAWMNAKEAEVAVYRKRIRWESPANRICMPNC